MVLERLRIDCGNNPEVLVVLLHGLGATGYDFEALPDELALDFPARYVFPHAPNIAVTINMGMVMPAWYDISLTDLGRKPDLEGLNFSSLAVEEILQQEYAEGFAPANTILGGFSQGGATALWKYMNSSAEFMGLVALSAYLPSIAELELPPKSKTTPIFLGHGTMDPVVPFSLALKTQEYLATQGFHSEFHSYAMLHSLSLTEIVDLRTFINKVCNDLNNNKKTKAVAKPTP